MQPSGQVPQPMHRYTIAPFDITALSNTLIFVHSAEEPETRGLDSISAQYLEPGYGLFTENRPGAGPVQVSLELRETALELACTCNSAKKKLCSHEARVLFCLMNRKEVRLFFDKQLRREALAARLPEYGLDPGSDPDDFFLVRYEDRQLQISPLLPGMIAAADIGREQYLQEHFFPPVQPAAAPYLELPENRRILVLCRHRYSDQLNIELMEAATGKDGRLKGAPLSLDPQDYLWRSQQPEHLKYYAALLKIRNEHLAGSEENDIRALQALAGNPFAFDCYYHDAAISANITLASLQPVQVTSPVYRLELSTQQSKYFRELTAYLWINGQPYNLQVTETVFRYFLKVKDQLYLVANPSLLRIIGYFRRHNYRLLIPHSAFDRFREQVLNRLEHKVHLTYSHVRPATPAQLREQGFDHKPERIIYLSEQENHIGILPVMRYGETEIPVLSRKQVYATDKKGDAFAVERDEKEELDLLGLLMRQHPDFAEQLDLEQFYLHKKKFLDEDWFLQAFAAWQEQGITILGFNGIRKNRLNQHTVRVSVQVSSGINWFNAVPEVTFGKQKASLKQLYKSVKNRSKYVQLDDGTLGILPGAWLEKFTRYFESGELHGETIRIPRINYAALLEAYEDQMMLPGVQQDILALQENLTTTKGLTGIPVSPQLQTNLRSYQQEGLNWLAFLDGLGFGACLADDMGLGKTIQIIAFLLYQGEKHPGSTHLIVMPTSLVFNWQEELQRFAPVLRVHTYYGPERLRSVAGFGGYDVILTTYGTLLSDISLLKTFTFGYTILDESQAIKNPDSERYKAAVQLRSRNRISLTGTPVENNTFDLYGQLSFACPGLLGNKHYFRNLYALPIDKFGNHKRARALQRKVAPFVLRRTKAQVAAELPEKTEIVLYCPMGEEQRRIYELQEQEIREFIETRRDEELSSNSMHILKGLTRLRQICNATTLINKEKTYGDHSSKIHVLMKELEKHAGTHKILVFSQFVSMLDLVREQLDQRQMAYAYLSGQTHDRAQQVRQFKEEQDRNIFLISLKAGGTGLNLAEADYVYLVDPWWNPAVEHQAIDRSYRIGQQNQVIAVRLICPDTVEDKILKLQATKKDLADNLIATGSSILKGLGKQELLELLR
ncbi:DEAD/DEAH box helicase [Taibaiella chishuiensis]|uniref:SNF2 helicase associated protein n=1 Tax=Taibaiella chishuiensis TaxID=1434707 RepID=A0A2P8D784_9BACT|nr:DEAD/DEAH box helicase [Taibaiella chishuiensis]PSK93084.1 SNF2 helicase associated protein [Taibaiella chishuiensis]